jgi:CheY-like chemotaxis protein
MTPQEVSVLFMDDEIHDTQATIVRDAVAALRQQGYDVTAVEKMSDAMDEFYRKFYKVFILDIDMSHVDDVLSQAGERGTRVAEDYRALDNGTAVIMFSAMGLVDDWVRVVNRHIFGYVHKGDERAIDRLVDLVATAAASDTRGLDLPTPRRSGQVLVCNAGASRFDEPALAQQVQAAGDFTPVFCTLGEMAERLTQDDFAAALLLADRFETRPAVLAKVDAVCAHQATPNVVIGCQGSDQARASILHLINARPFRLVNLLAGDAATALSEAVRDAAYWYGGNECFRAESRYVHRAAQNVDWQKLDEQFGASSEFDDDAREEEQP